MSESARTLATIIALTAGGVAGPVLAQEPGPVGTLIVAHGASEMWNAPVDSLAAQVTTGGPVAVSFLMGPAAGQRPFQAAARELLDAGASSIVVVPLLASSHSGHYEQIRWLSGLADSLPETMRRPLEASGIERSDLDVPVRLTPALDGAPELARVLVDRALALAQEPREQALFLIGHGPNSAEDHAAWMERLRVVADDVRAATGFRNVHVGLVRDDAPDAVRAEAVRAIRDVIALQYAATGHDVVVVPILISSGHVNRAKIPADLDGLPVVYDGKPLLPHGEITRWVERRVREAGAGALRRTARTPDGP